VLGVARFSERRYERLSRRSRKAPDSRRQPWFLGELGAAHVGTGRPTRRASCRTSDRAIEDGLRRARRSPSFLALRPGRRGGRAARAGVCRARPYDHRRDERPSLAPVLAEARVQRMFADMGIDWIKSSAE
jgi:hypothetical protein